MENNVKKFNSRFDETFIDKKLYNESDNESLKQASAMGQNALSNLIGGIGFDFFSFFVFHSM